MQKLNHTYVHLTSYHRPTSTNLIRLHNATEGGDQPTRRMHDGVPFRYKGASAHVSFLALVNTRMSTSLEGHEEACARVSASAATRTSRSFQPSPFLSPRCVGNIILRAVDQLGKTITGLIPSLCFVSHGVFCIGGVGLAIVAAAGRNVQNLHVERSAHQSFLFPFLDSLLSPYNYSPLIITWHTTTCVLTDSYIFSAYSV